MGMCIYNLSIIAAMLNPEIQDYNEKLSVQDKEICDQLMDLINSNLLDSESKVRHGHPVWFLN